MDVLLVGPKDDVQSTVWNVQAGNVGQEVIADKVREDDYIVDDSVQVIVKGHFALKNK